MRIKSGVLLGGKQRNSEISKRRYGNQINGLDWSQGYKMAYVAWLVILLKIHIHTYIYIDKWSRIVFT